jgi:predicted DNA-binding transcriptional regulator AlpA
MTANSRQVRQTTQPRRGLRREEAAIYIGISPTKFDQLVREGRMPQPKTIESVRVWDMRQLDLKFDALPGGDADETNPWG